MKSYVEKSSDPVYKVRTPAPMFTLLPNDQLHPSPHTKRLEARITPLVLKTRPVVDPDKAMLPEYVLLTVEAILTSLWMYSDAVPANVIIPEAGAPMVSFLQRIPPVTVPTVAVYEEADEAESKTTSS